MARLSINMDPADFYWTFQQLFICESTGEYKVYAVVLCVCLVLSAWCRVCRPVTYQIYTVRTFSSTHCTLCIHTASVESSHQMIMGAVLTYAAVWCLVHSQWISSSMGSVIKVSSRPLQLCNRTLHAEQGRRSSAIRKIMQVQKEEHFVWQSLKCFLSVK